MIHRILLIVICFCCGIQSASAGIIASADSEFDINPAVAAKMSPPVQPADAPLFRSCKSDFGVAGFTVNYSSPVIHALMLGNDNDWVIEPVIVGARLRLANASLPPSPFSAGLLKPS